VSKRSTKSRKKPKPKPQRKRRLLVVLAIAIPLALPALTAAGGAVYFGSSCNSSSLHPVEQADTRSSAAQAHRPCRPSRKS
jgi:flagellar basal body-associated protein FliL